MAKRCRSCCGAACNQPFHVTGCKGLSLAGATVDVQSPPGTSVASGATDASGNVTLSIPAAGSYTVVTSKSGTGYGTKTQALALDCATTRTIALAIDGGFPTLLLDTSGGSCKTIPTPDDTLTYQALPGYAATGDNANGWMGATDIPFQDLGFTAFYRYVFIKLNSANTYYLYMASPTATIPRPIMTDPAVATSCEPFLWGGVCQGLGATFTITEP